jgi:cytochrome c5
MKQGERNAFIVVGIAIIAVIALTVYLEIQHRKTHSVNPTTQARVPVTGNQSANTANSANNEDVTVIPSGMNPDQLPDADSHGATVLTLYCAQCHALPTPSMHTAAEWKVVLPRMLDYINSNQGQMMRHLIMPPEHDWETLTAYLIANAQVPLDKQHVTGLDTTAGKAFQTYCSQCHAAPDPGIHTPHAWPRVVLRMKSHILRTSKKMPTQDTLMQIIDYLQKHAKPEK